jgi:hypothetical protein
MVSPVRLELKGNEPPKRMSRQEAVKLEVASFLRAEARRQDGMATLNAAIAKIEGLVMQFGKVRVNGQTVEGELDTMQRRLKQVTPVAPLPVSVPI